MSLKYGLGLGHYVVDIETMRATSGTAGETARQECRSFGGRARNPRDLFHVKQGFTAIESRMEQFTGTTVLGTI